MQRLFFHYSGSDVEPILNILQKHNSEVHPLSDDASLNAEDVLLLISDERADYYKNKEEARKWLSGGKAPVSKMKYSIYCKAAWFLRFMNKEFAGDPYPSYLRNTHTQLARWIDDQKHADLKSKYADATIVHSKVDELADFQLARIPEEMEAVVLD